MATDSAAKPAPITTKRMEARRQRARVNKAAARMKRNGQIGSKYRIPISTGLNSESVQKTAIGMAATNQSKAARRRAAWRSLSRHIQAASARNASVAAGVFTAKAMGK